MNGQPHDNIESAGRRRALAALLGCAAMGGALVPFVRAVANAPAAPSLDKNAWRPLLSREASDALLAAREGSVRAADVRVERADNWRFASDTTRVYVVRDPARAAGLSVLSGICPHAGCTVNYDPRAKRFLCPCHRAEFSANGAVISGPSPRALDMLPARIGAAGLEVQVKRYRLNQREQVEA